MPGWTLDCDEIGMKHRYNRPYGPRNGLPEIMNQVWSSWRTGRPSLAASLARREAEPLVRGLLLMESAWQKAHACAVGPAVLRTSSGRLGSRAGPRNCIR